MAIQTPGYYYPTMYQQPQLQPQPMIQQPQINPIMSIPSRIDAQNYPVAPGNTMIFRKDDGSSVYLKTMSYSTTEPPIFEEYARVMQESQNTQNNQDSEIQKLWNEINSLKNQRSNNVQNNNDKQSKGNGGN